MKLQTKAISSDLHELLQQLMAFAPLKDFYLVGGTALALQYGHRLSIDLDLFTHKPFDARALSEQLIERFGMKEVSCKTNTILGQMNQIKTDFIAHRYPLIGKVVHANGIRLLPAEDIAAMKLNAIANRGSKKDFWDYAELLQHFDYQALLGFYAQKYPNGNRWALEKSLCYFDDAELEPDPITLGNQTWSQVKQVIARSCRIL